MHMIFLSCLKSYWNKAHYQRMNKKKIESTEKENWKKTVFCAYLSTIKRTRNVLSHV